MHPKVNLWFAQVWALAMLILGEVSYIVQLPVYAFVPLGALCTLGPLVWAVWENRSHG